MERKRGGQGRLTQRSHSSKNLMRGLEPCWMTDGEECSRQWQHQGQRPSPPNGDVFGMLGKQQGDQGDWS